ncbi:hypothetical protein [Reyranella sp.]|uniref:hypothetical protein n=1 Tax=Reyranella sp. TaxID=1929291 RepID=UPI003C7B79D6
MNVLFGSPVGALLARPWVDPVGLYGLQRWYLPLSRLWAAANLAGMDVARFREEIGLALPGFWSEARLRSLLARHGRAQARADETRAAWETGLFDPAGEGDPERLEGQRRAAATTHLATRALFYPLLFPRRPPLARWRIDAPEQVECELGPVLDDASALYVAPIAVETLAISRDFVRDGIREYWLRAPTPSARLQRRDGSEILYARVAEPVGGTGDTLIFGNGLCVESELMSMDRGPGPQLAAMGWRVIEPVSPYHGLRAMPGFYGGEPFFAASPTSSMDLIAGQAIESALLAAWARERFGGKVALAGISMSSFVAQLAASHCHLWPVEARPDAAILISHSGRVEDVTFGGALAAMLGLDRALVEAGWSRDSLARLSRAIDPAETPALPPSRIVSVLGETDRWVPYDDGLALARRWRLPEENVFRYRLGHLGMPIQLTRDHAAFARLRQVLKEG